MVHRAPDSRLLTNLITHEKEYARHFAALFPLSHAALSSLSAYAAASPAHPIPPVIDVLASADDALQRYAHALDTWRDQLVALKGLEDDLAAVLRDRDILVTRLIKASKFTREAHRSSRLGAPLTGLGSASLSSLPSTNTTTTTSAGPASTNAKLAQAQAELQACEAHLVAKERELDARRISIARDGLGARCRALIDCGWVWGEVGKQGLKALQALSTNGATSKASSGIPPHLSTNPTTYASDNSSLTPSQSASQTAARSAETSNEGRTSQEHERVTQPEAELENKPKPKARATRANDDEALTITLPPAHAISELAVPTAQRLQNGDPAAADTGAHPAPAPRRKRTKQPRRPPSHHITEVSDEGSDEPHSASASDHKANANASPRAPHTPFPTTRTARETHDTSSEDERATGPLQAVDNDPFEVIRRSMLGPSSSVLAHASAPDVRMNGVGETSPSKDASGQGAGPQLTPGSLKRQRKTSMAFFGSLRGLFRKPKERGGPSVDWDEGRSSPSPGTKAKGGWVTRTDARIGSRGGRDDSDEEPSPAGVGRRITSGARLRKGRPGASTREIGSPLIPSHRADVDGWVTDGPAGAGTGEGVGTSTGRSRTHRGMMKRKKTSVAELRGSDQGHTDGEVDGGGHRSLVRVSNKGRGGPSVSASGSKPKVGEETTSTRHGAAPTDTHPDPNANVSPGIQHRRATTTTGTSGRKVSSDAAPARRSASLSEAHVTSVSVLASTSGSMSWRKPPPQIEPSSRPVSPPQFQTQPSPRTHESQSKQNAKRHLGNGHAHVHKHSQNQSLMSIVADVARQNSHGWNEEVEPLDRAKSLDIPRAPGSVLGEVDRDRDRDVGGGGTNGRDHAKTTAMSEVGRQVGQEHGQGGGQGQGQRATKLPLRSALRNPNRTPSPSPFIPVMVSVPATLVPVGNDREEGVEEERGQRVVSPFSLRDSVSISSYETGRESLDGDESPKARSSPLRSPSPSPLRSHSQPLVRQSQSPVLHPRSETDRSSPPSLSFTFPPPPVDPPPVRGAMTASSSNPNANAIEQTPSSSVLTETPPARRKSVRVSLQPTFSQTPPVFCDEDGEGYAPWSASFSTGEERVGRARERKGGDVWADSSEEDEEYSRARELLSSVGQDKGKAKS